MRRIAITAMIGLGLWSICLAANPNLKTIYTVESSGPKNLSGVRAQAVLVMPDSATSNTVPFNTVSGAAYSISTPVDSAQSGTDGRVAIRLPLTSDIYPPGCRWQITYTYLSQPRRTVYVTMTDTVTRCLAYVLGQATTCP